MDDQARLKDLEARIEAAKGADAPKHHSEEHYSQANLAWRMVTELVAGLGLGCLIGMGLDTVLGTTPFLTIIFVLLGFVAGIKTVIRSAQELDQQGPDAAGQKEE